MHNLRNKEGLEKAELCIHLHVVSVTSGADVNDLYIYMWNLFNFKLSCKGKILCNMKVNMPEV